ncbi:putative ribonuclease H-like domain-containing protein [Tanacetum coccineum]
MGNHTLQQLKRLSFDEIKNLFEATMRRVCAFVPMEIEIRREVHELAAGSSKRDAEEELDQGSSKRQKTSENSEPAEESKEKEDDELSQEELQQLMIIVPEEGMNLKRLFEPDVDDELCKSHKHVHDITWRLYDICGVHHVSTKDGIGIYMLVEMEYPLSRGVLTQMLAAKLLVEQNNEMSKELLRKIFMMAERPRRTLSTQDLIIKEKMESQSETTQTVSALKLPILKTGDYDLWSMRMEQYLTHTDYALWKVIMNGDVPTIALASIEGLIPPKTAEQKLARKNELKAKSTLLLAIPDEHLLKFHGVKDAKTLWEAIKARFQKLISQLEIHGEVTPGISPDVAALTTEVAMLTMRVNKFLKKTGKNLNFNGKETLSFDKTKVECYNCHMRGHFATEYRAPRNQGNRNGDNTRRVLPVETPANALVVQDGIGGYDWSFQAKEGLTNFALMAYTSQGSSSSSSSDFEREALNKSNLEIIGYQIGLESLEARIVVHEKNEAVYEEDIAFLKFKTAVATKSGQVPVNAAKQSSPRAAASISTARPVNTAAPKSKVNDALPITYSYFKAHSPVRRAFNQKSAAKTNNFNEKVNTARVNNVTTAGPKAVVSAAVGNGENVVKSSACWIWRPTGNVIDHNSKDSGSYMLKRFDYVDLQGRLNGCSRHMTGNKSFLTYYQEIDGGFVAFGGSPKGGKITGKGKIRTGKLDFEDVYFVKELKFNLFSVSQMCDKKNSVLFTETECLVLSLDFKLLDESQVLLKVPRHDNMYSFDLKNVVPSGGLTCLFAKATIDESNLWHRRLGHINFKTMNKLVRGNLVRGFPSKPFENDHTCVACQKGKQHKAACKTKLVSSINQPLQMLHMDLFGPTSVRSINHKTYCLVVTDDFSRFSWVFFLATKDETSGILKTFITGIENQINYKVKIIRCDNGTEFKDNDMNQFCGMKGIKREFSVARTPQQNGVVERKNRTLMEEARTMLADSLLPTTFWAEAVNTACYVQNRVQVTKPHNKTPYELLHGST